MRQLFFILSLGVLLALSVSTCVFAQESVLVQTEEAKEELVQEPPLVESMDNFVEEIKEVEQEGQDSQDIGNIDLQAEYVEEEQDLKETDLAEKIPETIQQ